jgi:levanbiose-producing levanase
VNTFHPQVSDGATGSATSPPFTVDQDHLRVRIGGGGGTDVGVELLVDGAQVAVTRGANSEALHDVAIDVRPWRGRSARVRLTDLSLGAWGHLLVDDIALCPAR